MDRVKVRCVGRNVLNSECVTSGDILFKSISGHLFLLVFFFNLLEYLRQLMLRIHEVHKNGRMFLIHEVLKDAVQHAKEDI